MKYTQKAFFDENDDGTLQLKKMLVCDASDGEPFLKKGTLALLQNYKSNNSLGRRDSLAKKDVVLIPLPKGNLALPLDEMAEFAELLYSLAHHIPALLTENE